MRELEHEAEVVQDTLSRDGSAKISAPAVLDTLTRFVALLDASEPERLKALLHVLIERITVKKVLAKRSIDTIELRLDEKVHSVLDNSEADGRKRRGARATAAPDLRLVI